MMYGMKTNTMMLQSALIIIALSFTGCTGPKADISETVSMPMEETTVSITPQSEIIVPSYLEGTETDALSVVSRQEDSTTYQLTRQQQEAAVSLLMEQTEDSIAQVLTDKQYYPSITDITYNQDFTSFDVVFTSANPSLYETTLRMSLYITGNKLQLYLGRPAEEILTVVNYIDGSTGEVFSTGTSEDISKE